ncbi:hypothetical protein [Fluviicola sp.]|uniref:ArnT family glycosyltransferase n=1 Tax=Fluviicola sp. TaxID=1917219 RepID=UPI0031CEE2DB
MTQGLEKILAKRWMIFLLFLSLTYLFGTKSDRRYGWTKTVAKQVIPISSDAAGYYAFLPEWFIYEGNNFAFHDSIRDKYPKAGFEDGVERNEDGTYHDKYFTGTAQCLTPFFLIGHAHAHIIGVDTDGYTWPYIFWLNIGMGFYAMIGLIALFLLLRRLKIGYFGCYIAVLSVALGTNFSYYVYAEIPYSHIFCFSIVNVCLLQGVKWIQENKTKNLWFFGFLLGLCLMIRPTNALILVLIPFLFSSNKEFAGRMAGLFKAWKHLLVMLLLFVIPVIIQMWFFYLQMGKIGLNAYSDEGFTNWNDPYFLEILFGFRRGIFIYGPVMLLLIPGLVWMFFKKRRMFAGILLFILLSTYVLSSWWCWWYGGSFGFRPIVDFCGIWIIPVAFLAHHAKTWGRMLILILVAGFVWVYQTYEFQRKKDIIHYDYVNYGMWKETFMQTDSRFNFAFYSDVDTLPAKKVQVGSPVDFYEGDRKLVPGKIYGYNGKQFVPERAVAVKHVQVKDSNAFAGLRITFQGYLNSGEENPFVRTQYFKNGNLVMEKDMLAGWRFPRVKTWQNISIDVIPDRKWSEIDSVKCSFLMGEKAMKFKDLQLRLFKLK